MKQKVLPINLNIQTPCGLVTTALTLPIPDETVTLSQFTTKELKEELQHRRAAKRLESLRNKLDADMYQKCES